MTKPELLLPAGNIEKMNYALHYGADAVYLGTSDYSLRNTTQGEVITRENIPEAIKTVHNLNKKIYVTINIFAHNKDINILPEFLEFLNDVKPDAIIFSDIGVGSLIKKYAPAIPLHLSTQANTTNYISAQTWYDFGVERIILARELSLQEIEEIKHKVPGLELEIFIHGSLCISYSGRCILSDYLTENTRKSNQGSCAQGCRWKYFLMEETRPNEYYNITEDDRGSYIMNTRDLCLMEYIPELINVGVDSFKVEGRAKSVYYASVVARAYRNAINKILNKQSFDPQSYIEELMTAGNRGFTTNFLFKKPVYTDYDYVTSKGKAGLTFLATTISDKIIENKILIKARNQLKLNTKVEWITPNQTIPDEIRFILSERGGALEVANTNNEVYINAPETLDECKWAILRSRNE